MMTCKRTLLTLIISMAMAIMMASTTLSVQAIDNMPLKRVGVIDGIYPDKNKIIIDDLVYEIVPYVIVHDKNNDYIGTQYLKPSMPIRFSMETVTGSKSSITQVWILDEIPTDPLQLLGISNDQ